MGDAAKGIKAFRDGMKDDHEPPPTVQATAEPRRRSQAEKDPIVR